MLKGFYNKKIIYKNEFIRHDTGFNSYRLTQNNKILLFSQFIYPLYHIISLKY